MRPYIVNLTNNLIGKHRFNELIILCSQHPEVPKRMSYRDSFIGNVKNSLEASDVQDMAPETLGKIMCSMEIGDIRVGKEELVQNLYFAGDCNGMLRCLVSYCLACVIYERLNHPGVLYGDIPSYRPSSKSTKNS
jgi:hypothetical protein